MAVCSCTFSCTIFVLLVTLCIVFMYNLTVIATCKEKSDSYWCLKPEYFMKTKMQLMVYVSTQEKSSWMTQHNETNFMRNETILRELNVTIPQSTLNNGTLYAHIFVGPQNKSPEKISNHDKFTIITAPLTKYLIPFAAEFNLATGEYESTVINTSSSPVSHWIPVLDILGVGEDWYLLPDEILLKSHSIKVDPGKLTYLPIIKCDHMKVLNRQLQRITVDNTTLPVTITYSSVGLGQLRVWINFQQTWTVFNTLGFILKELVFNNFYLMMLTFLLGFIQMLFDFLAFINDISFWRKMKTTYGLSKNRWPERVITVFWNCFILPVIFLYLMEVEETLLILVPHGISTIIVYWKLWKVLKVKVKWIHRLPRLEFGRQLASEQQTDFYDSQSMKQFHNYILIPLVIGGGIYSLMYLSYYKSVYSCVIHSVANGLYAFGFLFMLPQLFVNYKLKSVAHLPWRAFMYKALCTFTDDVLVFTISMPTSYRVAVFRDDLVFLVYLYQRWLYSVDKKTVKKYRKTFKDAVLKEKQN